MHNAKVMLKMKQPQIHTIIICNLKKNMLLSVILQKPHVWNIIAS